MEIFSQYKNKKILITGGLGFIGSNLARKLVKFQPKITIIDSLIPKYGGNLFNIKGIENKVKVNIADIRDQYGLNYLVQNHDLIFNLAGSLSHIDSMKDPFTDLDINCRSQLSLLEACRKHNPKVKIIYAGTRNQYGRPKYLPVDEDHPQIPVDVNGINCIAGEHYHLLYYRIYGIKTISLRMTNTFGPRHQMKHPRQGVLNWFIRKIIDNEKIFLFGGEQIRDVNFIDDTVDAFLLAGIAKKGWGQAYNLGGSPTTLKDFVKLAIKIAGRGSFKISTFPEERKKIEVGNYIANWNKAKRNLDWKPKISLKVGIKKTIKFYQRFKKHYW